MDRRDEARKIVLCAANAYRQKYYLNPDFLALPEEIQEELRTLCVRFTEDVGGVLALCFDGAGNLRMEVSAAEDDFFFDEIGSELKIRQLQREKGELFAQLELFYRTFWKPDR